jgi:hypothetical protein
MNNNRPLRNNTNNYDIPFQEIYRQAHETRRKWENYIWQWGVLVTALLAISTQFDVAEVTCLSIIQKLILTLITLFTFAIFLNVLRARTLMKELEKSIKTMHDLMNFNIPVIPIELNIKDNSSFRNISSTYFAVICHFITFIAFAGISIYVWIT